MRHVTVSTCFRFLNNFNKLALKNVEYLEFSDKMLR